jgi:aspartate aminotransferase
LFETSKVDPPDALRRIAGLCAVDPRNSKVDLLVGVYRDSSGQTPVMSAVRLAQTLCGEQEQTKSYISVEGRQSFIEALIKLVLVKNSLIERSSGVQTVGGAGAVRILLDLVKRLQPDTTVWLSNVGYAGHEAIAHAAGVPIKRFQYFDPVARTLDSLRLIRTLSKAKAGDVVILDSSCHNPTGLDLPAETWAELGTLCAKMGVVPLIDVAYQGLGTDLDADVQSIALLSNVIDYALVAVSCSKTFGIYRERAGAAIVIGPGKNQLAPAIGNLANIAYGSYGVPPDHGAAIVDAILRNDELRSSWVGELEHMRRRLRDIRLQFWRALKEQGVCCDLESVRSGNGLFWLLPLNEAQISDLRQQYAVYALDNGRINLACLKESQIYDVSKSICAVMNS